MTPLGKYYRVEAIVLRSILFGEGNLLLTLLTLDGSKLRAVAWGARKLTSRKMGHLEPLTRVDLALSRSLNNADTVSQAYSMETFSVLKADLNSTAKGFYLAELVDGFAMEDSPNPSLYTLLLDTLHLLQNSECTDVLIFYFQLCLLRINGFMPELYHCVECRDVISSGDHGFIISLGGVICTRCGPKHSGILSLSVQALKVLRYFHRSKRFDSYGLRISSLLQEEIRIILDTATRYWLDREIKSMGFMDQVTGRR